MKQLRLIWFPANKKTLRNQLLRDYAQLHPELSLTEIGKIFGITKQRVFEILRAK